MRDVDSHGNRARWGATPKPLAFAHSPTPSPKALLIPSETENPRCKQRGFSSLATYYCVMNDNDDKLRALLRRWRDIEPRANFEANVWRRIRLAQTEEPGRVSIIQLLLRQWLRQPAVSIAAAVVLSLALGTSLGILTTPRTARAERQELGFLAPGSLAGGYLRVTTERAQ